MRPKKLSEQLRRSRACDRCSAATIRRSVLATGVCALLTAAWVANRAAPSASAAAPTSSAGAASATIPVAARAVDESLHRELHAGVSPAEFAPRTDDEAFVRRAYLDLVGEWPSAAELTAFVFDPAPNKRAELVDRLLDDPRYGLNWGRYWRDVVLYRRAEDRALLSSAAAVKFFAGRLHAVAPWSEFAREIVTATGAVTENGATILFVAQMADPNEVAAEVSRIFCGVQISCAQCHDHPTDRWKREQFHELAAFFPRVNARPILVNGMQRGIEIVGRDTGPRFGGQNANNPRFRPIEHYMPDLKNPAAQGTLMTPVFFATGDKLEAGATDARRRATLAQRLTSRENPWFARAVVNRLWSELVGEGFYEPVDDLGPERDCTAPQTLDLLCEQFIAGDYDLKRLFRTILATEAYQRESRPRRNAEQTPMTANVAHRLRGDPLYDALLGALGMPQDDEAAAVGAAAVNPRAMLGSPRAQFNQAFGYDPSVRRDEIAGSIPQSLVLMNSPNVAQGLNGANPRSALGKLLSADRTNESVVVELYLRCLAREPNDRELAACLDYVAAAPNRTEGFEDVLWSLVNSTEFLYRR